MPIRFSSCRAAAALLSDRFMGGRTGSPLPPMSSLRRVLDASRYVLCASGTVARNGAVLTRLAPFVGDKNAMNKAVFRLRSSISTPPADYTGARGTRYLLPPLSLASLYRLARPGDWLEHAATIPMTRAPPPPLHIFSPAYACCCAWRVWRPRCS